MLSLPIRACQVGGSINTRTEKHGEDNVAALDIPVTFLLEPVELCVLLKAEEAAHRLFAWSKAGPGDPAIPSIKSFGLSEKIEGARATLAFDGLQGPVELVLPGVKLSKIRLEPKFAGKTECSLTIQTTPDFDDKLMQLFEHMNGECSLSIEAPNWNSQTELPLEQPETEAAADEPVLEETES